MNEAKDAELLERIGNGSKTAFGILTERHAMRAYRVAYRIVGQREDAEDIVQDVLLKLWREPWRYNALAGGTFSSWLYRVINNAAFNLIKRRKFEHPDSKAVEQASDDGEQLKEMELREVKRQVEKALQSLSPRQQQAVVLCVYEGFSNREAAEVMEVSIAALQSLLVRAKANLKVQLGNNDMSRK